MCLDEILQSSFQLKTYSVSYQSIRHEGQPHKISWLFPESMQKRPPLLSPHLWPSCPQHHSQTCGGKYAVILCHHQVHMFVTEKPYLKQNIIILRMAGCYTSGEEKRHCRPFNCCTGHIHRCMIACWIWYEALWGSVCRQAHGTSCRQQRAEALINHGRMIRHELFRRGKIYEHVHSQTHNSKAWMLLLCCWHFWEEEKEGKFNEKN